VFTGTNEPEPTGPGFLVRTGIDARGRALAMFNNLGLRYAFEP
jgi:hypothetical protein